MKNRFNSSRNRCASHGTVARSVNRGMESLEGRRLMAFAPVDLVAFWNDNQSPSTGSASDKYRRSVNFYDATSVPGGSTAEDYFNQIPLFSIWTGYENVGARNQEDAAALDIDEERGLLYFLAFDNVAGGTEPPRAIESATGDHAGDYDLHRYDLKTIYQDFVTNSRARGTMYAAPISAEGFSYLDFYGPAGEGASQYNAADPARPLVNGDDSAYAIPPERNNTDADASNDIVFLPAIGQARVGEIVRRLYNNANGITGNQQQIQVVDEDTILLMEGRSTDSVFGGYANDYTIRTIERIKNTQGVSTPGLAVDRSGELTEDGGYNGDPARPETMPAESWEAVTWRNAAGNVPHLAWAMDGDYSEADGMVYVERDGVRGVWLSELDRPQTGAGFGDEFAFYQLDFANRTGRKLQITSNVQSTPAPYWKLGESADVANSAADQSNGGEVDWFDLDINGNFVISESGFSDTPLHQPKLVTRPVLNYNADTNGDGIPEIVLGASTYYTPVAPTLVDDPAGEVINGNYGSYSKALNCVYWLDNDQHPNPSNPLQQLADPRDLYVYSLDGSGSLVYQERDAYPVSFTRDANSTLAFRLTSNTDTIAPTITSVTLNSAGTKQLLQVQFSEDVRTSIYNVLASLQAGDFILTVTGAITGGVPVGTTIPSSAITLDSYNAGTNTAFLSFSGISGAAPKQLPSGRYSLSVGTKTISDAGGNDVAAGVKGSFGFMTADFNSSGATDFNDLLILAANFNTSGKTFAQGDANYDGGVNFNDLLLLAANFNKSLPIAMAPAASLLAAAPAQTTASKRTRTASTIIV